MDRDYPLDQILSVMKPNKLDKEKPKHVQKFNEMLSDDSPYIAEEKLDGNHYTAIKGRFFSTHISSDTQLPVEKTMQLPHLFRALSIPQLGQAIFDGEVFYPGWKSNQVTSITGSMPDEAITKQSKGDHWLFFGIFDVLRTVEGVWLVNQPWYVRRKYLESLQPLLQATCPQVFINPFVTKNKKDFMDNILNNGREGIVLKNVHGLYECGKRPQWNWVKYKTEVEDDVIIMGFEPPERIYNGKNLESWPYWEDGMPVTKFHAMKWIGSIVFGKYNSQGELERLGTCTGMDEAQRVKFTENPDLYIGRVAHIKAMEINESGAYRHPSFQGIHPDKNAYECRIDT